MVHVSKCCRQKVTHFYQSPLKVFGGLGTPEKMQSLKNQNLLQILIKIAELINC